MIGTSVSASAGWFTSSCTNGSGTCVEVKFGDNEVLVRDTKNRRPVLSMPSAGWAVLVSVLNG